MAGATDFRRVCIAAVMLGAIAIAVFATLIPLLRRRNDVYDEE